jgi:hypothetical protein
MFGRKKKPKDADPFAISWGQALAVIIGVNVLGSAMDWDGATCWFVSMVAVGGLGVWKFRGRFAEAMRESAAERSQLQAAYDTYAAIVVGQQRIEALKRDIAFAAQRVDMLEAQEG